MKKLLGVIAIIAAVGTLVLGVRNMASAQEGTIGVAQIGVTQVVCDGAICGGSGSTPCGTRQFVYVVKPNGNSITSLDVGTDDGNPAHYTNLCVPAGWSATFASVQRPHRLAFDPHGAVVNNAGQCSLVMRFTGPSQTQNFRIGYDTTVSLDIHDVNWKTSDGRQTSWTFPLGLGNGPVHAPFGP